MENNIKNFVLSREKKESAFKETDVTIASINLNTIEICIKPNWCPGDNEIKTLASITAKKMLVLNLNHPHAYGHIYTEVLSELYSVDENYPEYDCIITILTPFMKNIIEFFNLKMSSKIRFIKKPEDRKKSFILNFEHLKIINHAPETYINKAKNLFNLKRAFHLKPVKIRNQNILLYCSRNVCSKTPRNDGKATARNGRRLTQENEDKIIDLLKEYAIKNNLEFCLLTGQESDGTVTPISKQYELFSNAKLVVGVHGGVMSNLIFLNPSKYPKVIEFCPIAKTNFDEFFDNTISNFVEYHHILYQLSPEIKTLDKQQLWHILKDIESTIDLTDLKKLL